MNTFKTSLKVFKTCLSDEKQIFITKTLLNLLSTISVCSFSDSNMTEHEVSNSDIRTIISADVNNSTEQIVSLTDCLEILLKKA